MPIAAALPAMVTIAYLDQIQGVPSRNQLIPNDLFFLSLNQNARPENIISNLPSFIVRTLTRLFRKPAKKCQIYK